MNNNKKLDKLTVEEATGRNYNFVDCVRYYFPEMEGYQAVDYLMEEVKELEAEKVLNKLYELYEEDQKKTTV